MVATRELFEIGKMVEIGGFLKMTFDLASRVTGHRSKCHLEKLIAGLGGTTFVGLISSVMGE